MCGSGAQRISWKNRNFGNNEKIIRGARIIHKYHKKIAFIVYDVIVDNPYEPVEDVAETFRLLLKLPRPFQVNLFSMTFFPGTDLYNKAKADGLIQEDFQEIYRKMISRVERNYINTVIRLVNLRMIPTFLLKPLRHPCAVRLMSRAPRKALSALEMAYFILDRILSRSFSRGRVITIHGVKATMAK